MDTKVGDSDLKKLFRYNRVLPTAAIYRRIEEIEGPWLAGLIVDLERVTTPVASRAEWVERLGELLTLEGQGSDSSRFLATDATHEQFRRTAYPSTSSFLSAST
jgi:hypothetical protein